MSLSYRNPSIDLLSKSIDWFLYTGKLVVKGLKLYRKNLALTSNIMKTVPREVSISHNDYVCFNLYLFVLYFCNFCN